MVSSAFRMQVEENRQITAKDYSAQTEPIPLPGRVPPPQLQERLLPEPWREWLTDIAERFQCPIDFPAVGAVVSTAALIGNKIRMRPKRCDPWLVTPNLWGAIVGEPSTLKSPALKEALIFFFEIADQERLNYEEKLKEAEFDKEFAETKQSELKKLMRKEGADKESLRSQFRDLEVEIPKEKRLYTSDPSVEKLGVLLNENETGVLLYRDELTGLLRSLDKPGREADRSFYLECFDGAGSFTFDRIGRGKIHIKNLTLSLLGTIQPAMLIPYLRGAVEGYRDDGLVQRLQLLVHPEKPKTYEFIDRPPKGRDQARNSFRRLYEIDSKKIGAKILDDKHDGIAYLQFEEKAQEFFKWWLTDLEIKLRSGGIEPSAYESHLAKYRSLMPSLALIFHLLDFVSSYQSTDISLQNAKKAAEWCDYLAAHAESIYQLTSLSNFEIARGILKKIKSRKLKTEFTARDIYKNNWSNLSEPKDVQRGLEILIEYGYLIPIVINEGHRPKTIYIVHENLK